MAGIIREQTLGMLLTPPKFGCGLVVVGNVPNIQVFDATNGSYEPNYSLTPLTIDPVVAAIDGDMPMSTNDARTMLTNIHWYEISTTGALTPIVISGSTSTPVGYTALNATEGSPLAGRIQVAKNASPDSPVRLRFEADLIYAADVFHVVKDISVTCRDVSPSVRCKFDTPDVVAYNPIHDSSEQPITLRVWENGRTADPTHFIPVWEVRRDDGSWSEYDPYDPTTGAGTPTDYWLDIAADKMSAQLNMDLMGDGVSIRVRLKYDREGNPAAITLAADDLSVPFCRLEATRTLGRYDSRMSGMTNTLAKWTSELRPEVIFKDNQGDITNPDNFFRVTFYAGPASRALAESDKIGVGRSMKIPASRGGSSGLNVGYAVEEIGPYKAWEDSDGKIITDSDGKILLIR